ncbi:hypothetical protein ACFUPZ_00140 [Microbacterium oxydans]|uniref:hypothetical protein n=1 Tax=Microbacterium oxydans TaxID=82380 RepID=UPI00362BBC77
MAGTRVGGLKAAQKILAKDPLHYSKIGTKGGRATTDKPKGFAVRPDIAAKAGKLGSRKGIPNRT